jgi:hypothetical protein
MRLTEKVCKLIQEAANNGMYVAELEYLGVSVKTLNLLESKHQCVTLQDLISLNKASIDELGDISSAEVMSALSRFNELEKHKKEWEDAYSLILPFYDTKRKR